MAAGEPRSGGPAGLYDMHVHTRFSPDSGSDLAVICRRAAEMGIPGLCFTDHAEFAPGDVVPGEDELDEMMGEIRALRRAYDGVLEIGFGVEIGYYRGRADDIAAFLAARDFDFVLASVHVSGTVGYSFPATMAPGTDPVDYFAPYLEDLRRMVDEVDCDSIGHMDLPKRFGPPLPGCNALGGASPLWRDVSAFLGEIVRRGILLEINASGLRQNSGETYPSGEVLREYRRLGGDAVTLGSDSHQPSHTGWGLDRAATAAREAGIHRAAYFLGRRPHYYPL